MSLESETPFSRWKGQHQEIGSMADSFTSDQGFAGMLGSLTDQLASHLGSIDQTLEEAMKNQSSQNQSMASNSTASSQTTAQKQQEEPKQPVE